MHDCPRSEESGSLYSCSNTVFLRSLRAFRLRSACHIQFYYPRLLSKLFLAGEVQCWDVSASFRIPWQTCILQRGVGCSNTQLRWASLQACAAFSSARGGISQARYTGATMKPLPQYCTLWCQEWSHTSTLDDLIWSVAEKSAWAVVHSSMSKLAYAGFILRTASAH